MSWRVLVAHSEEAVALSVKLHLLGEFEDVVVRLARSPEQALALIGRESLDLALCQLDPAEPRWESFLEDARASARGGPLPMVMLLNDPPGGLKESLAARGLPSLIMPFSPSRLRETVLASFNPRNRRSSQRLSIMGVRAEVDVGGQLLPAQVHNLSMGGMLAELEYPEDSPALLGPVRVRLIFDQRGRQAQAEGIEACLLRLSVDCFQDRLWPRIVRAAWRFVEVPAAAESLLAEVLGEAERSLEQVGLGADGLAV